jgi:tRNA threonylcarbamoyladenosine biosynthesis protein TsaE
MTPVIAELRVPTAADMRGLGRRLAALLRAGDLVVLTGPLGAGKTTLAAGIGEGLGVRGPVTSPTFVIARVHPGADSGPDLVHADAYRLGSRAEVDDLDLDADTARSVTVVEWGEGLVEDLADGHLEVSIAMAAAGDPADPADPGEPGAREREAAEPDAWETEAEVPRTVRLVGRGGRWEAVTESARIALADGLDAL